MFSYKKIQKTFFAFTLVMAFFYYILSPEKASAIAVPVLDLTVDASIGALAGIETARGVADGLEAVQNNLYRQSYCLKETQPSCLPPTPASIVAPLTLDSVANFLAKTAAQQAIRSVTNWVKSGFDGKPRFVQDLKQYYINEAYNTVDEMLNEYANIDMCNFFPDIKTTISLSGPRTRANEARCTLDEIQDQARAFQDDFMSGKWLTFKKSLAKENNPFGLFIFTQQELKNKQAENKEDQKTKLGWAAGFLGEEELDEDGKKTGKILTPGTVIVKRASAFTGLDIESLQVVDELDELVSALLNMVIQRAMNEAQGFFN